MSACPPWDLCADMAAYPHKAVVAAQGSAHVELSCLQADGGPGAGRA